MYLSYLKSVDEVVRVYTNITYHGRTEWEGSVGILPNQFVKPLAVFRKKLCKFTNSDLTYKM